MMSKEHGRTQRYHNEEWFKESEQGSSLVGIKCKLCGMPFFPRRSVCTRCHGEEIEELELSRTGTLFTYTKVYIPSKNFSPPYVIGYIDLPEGIRIFSQIKDWEERELKMGMEMELVIEPLWEDKDGVKIIGYKFRPSVRT